MAPVAHRPALVMVAALSLELAQIAPRVSEPLMGHIRLTWWREAVEEMVAGMPPRHHPLLHGLATALPPTLPARTYILDQLRRMIEARAVDLDPGPIADRAAWDAYCDGTTGTLHRAWAAILSPNFTDRAGDQAAVTAHAHAAAVIGLVRTIPSMHAHGFLRFPLPMLQAHGLSTLAPSPGVNALVASLVDEARAIQFSVEIAAREKPLAALLALNRMHIKRLTRIGYNPYALQPARALAVLHVMKMNIM